MRPSGRPQVAIVFMVMRGRLPRHRLCLHRPGCGTVMRYGICDATAPLPMPPLPASVVPTPEVALPVAPFRPALALPAPLGRAAHGAVPVAPVTPRADRHPGAAPRAEVDPVAVHRDCSPPGAGQPRRPSRHCARTTQRRKPLPWVRRKLGVLSTLVAGLPSCTGLMVADPCSRRHRRRHPSPPATGGFAAAAGNQSQVLRCAGWNQSHAKPPDSGGFTQPSTDAADAHKHAPP